MRKLARRQVLFISSIKLQNATSVAEIQQNLVKSRLIHTARVEEDRKRTLGSPNFIRAMRSSGVSLFRKQSTCEGMNLYDARFLQPQTLVRTSICSFGTGARSTGAETKPAVDETGDVKEFSEMPGPKSYPVILSLPSLLSKGNIFVNLVYDHIFSIEIHVDVSPSDIK